jgi:hypothetical protein
LVGGRGSQSFLGQIWVTVKIELVTSLIWLFFLASSQLIPHQMYRLVKHPSKKRTSLNPTAVESSSLVDKAPTKKPIL